MIKRVIIGTTVAAAGWAVYLNVRRWWKTWGVDTAIVERWREQARESIDGASAPWLAAFGSLLESSLPRDFAASSAFVVEPVGDGRTRLLERFRVWFGEQGPASRTMAPFLGFGVFVVTQRQMVGIKRRAEARARTVAETVPPATPSAAVEPPQVLQPA